MSSSETGPDPGEAGERLAPQDPGSVTAAKALAMVSALGETLAEIGRRLERYSVFGRRSRKIIIGLAVSFALDIALTVVLGFTAFTAHDAASSNTALVAGLHAANLTSCGNGNRFRAAQDTIWRDFIAILAKPSPGESAAQVTKTDKLAAEFLAYVTRVNHPVNCAALYGKAAK